MAAQNEEEERRAAAASVIQAKFRENASRTKDKGLEQSQEEKTTKASDAGVEKQRHNELDSDKRWDGQRSKPPRKLRGKQRADCGGRHHKQTL